MTLQKFFYLIFRKILSIKTYEKNIELNIEAFSKRKRAYNISYITPRKPGLIFTKQIILFKPFRIA